MIKKSTTIGMFAAIVFLGFLIALPVNSLATPIEVNVTVGYKSETANVTILNFFGKGSHLTNRNVYTDYNLDIELKGGTHLGNFEAFCVQGVQASGNKEEYGISNVPEDLEVAAWLADQWWTGGYSDWGLSSGSHLKSDFQIAIWEIVLDPTSWKLNEGNFKYNSGANIDNINKILDKAYGQTDYTNSGKVAWVHNPVDHDPENPGYQNYLAQYSVPEPGTMLFLGLGLVFLAVLRRKSFLKP